MRPLFSGTNYVSFREGRDVFLVIFVVTSCWRFPVVGGFFAARPSDKPKPQGKKTFDKPQANRLLCVKPWKLMMEWKPQFNSIRANKTTRNSEFTVFF